MIYHAVIHALKLQLFITCEMVGHMGFDNSLKNFAGNDGDA